jgi:hypothetical protein
MPTAMSRTDNTAAKELKVYTLSGVGTLFVDIGYVTVNLFGNLNAIRVGPPIFSGVGANPVNPAYSTPIVCVGKMMKVPRRFVIGTVK